MDKKAQVGIGLFIGIAVTIIVALVIFQASVQNYEASVHTRSLINGTYTAPAAGSTIDLIGQELLDTPIVTNATDGGAVPASNYTIQEAVSATDGLKRITYTTNSGPWESQSVNVSYTYGPEGYMESSGARAVTGLIAIFAALAVGVVALVPSLRSKIFG